jgi:hypothetical protein
MQNAERIAKAAYDAYRDSVLLARITPRHPQGPHLENIIYTWEELRRFDPEGFAAWLNAGRAARMEIAAILEERCLTT